MDTFRGELHNEIMREYEAIRSKNEAAYKNIKKQIYVHQPRIKEIDEELAILSLKSCESLLKPNAKHTEIITKLQKDTERLINEKNDILIKEGMPISCMDEIYTCLKCKDKGSYDNKWCECYYEKMQKLMHKKSNISSDKMHSFDKFDLSLYSNSINEEYGASPRENAQGNYNIAKKYASFDDSVSRQLLMYGNTGLGKTFTSECIAREFIKKGKDVYYTSSPSLFSLFEDYKFGRDSSVEARRIIEYISSADLLIIDDLGTEFNTQYTDSILFDIVNTRTKENKYMIISTNLTPSQIETTYSERISSRILGNFEQMLFFGDDLRLINK